MWTSLLFTCRAPQEQHSNTLVINQQWLSPFGYTKIRDTSPVWQKPPSFCRVAITLSLPNTSQKQYMFTLNNALVLQAVPLEAVNVFYNQHTCPSSSTIRSGTIGNALSNEDPMLMGRAVDMHYLIEQQIGFVTSLQRSGWRSSC